jgi:hypothetical protein
MICLDTRLERLAQPLQPLACARGPLAEAQHAVVRPRPLAGHGEVAATDPADGGEGGARQGRVAARASARRLAGTMVVGRRAWTTRVSSRRQGARSRTLAGAEHIDDSPDAGEPAASSDRAPTHGVDDVVDTGHPCHAGEHTSRPIHQDNVLASTAAGRIPPPRVRLNAPAARGAAGSARPMGRTGSCQARQDWTRRCLRCASAFCCRRSPTVPGPSSRHADRQCGHPGPW